MNASLGVQGLLIASGAFLIREAFPPGRARALGIALVATNGAGAALVGFVPEDTNRALHDIGALAIFLSGNLGMLALGTALLSGTRLRALGASAFALGAIGIAGSILFVTRPVAGMLGVFEHLAVDMLPLWLLSAGVVLLRNEATSQPPVSTR